MGKEAQGGGGRRRRTKEEFNGLWLPVVVGPRTLEVRRNPLRSAARKDLGKEGRATPRQRLLGARRRVGAGSEQGGRRPRPTAYMNTRSVTRKMYNVGATYQAPTGSDETEWKEWPVHGMHERPVYHPQVRTRAPARARESTLAPPPTHPPTPPRSYQRWLLAESRGLFR
jgi:hypothetical protein